MQLASVSVMVPSFTGAVEVEDIRSCHLRPGGSRRRAAAGLRDGEVPLLLLFQRHGLHQGRVELSVG